MKTEIGRVTLKIEKAIAGENLTMQFHGLCVNLAGLIFMAQEENREMAFRDTLKALREYVDFFDQRMKLEGASTINELVKMIKERQRKDNPSRTPEEIIDNLLKQSLQK